MGLKEDLKRELRNVKHDTAKEVERQFIVPFSEHTIEVHNEMMKETLLVDGIVLDEVVRTSFWSHLKPFSKLTGTFTGKSGHMHTVQVKIGGYLRLRIRIQVDGQVLLDEALKLAFLPWTNKAALVPYLEQQIATHGAIVNKELPDDHYWVDEYGQKPVPGEGDQLIPDVVLPGYVKKVLKLFLAQVEQPSDTTRKATYEKVNSEKVICYFHELVELFMEQEVDAARVQQEALWLLEHAAHREVVKFALVILGCTKYAEANERLQHIALHEEFTGVALFALKNSALPTNAAIFAIAQSVTGWGKLEALNFLEPETVEIEHWFVTDGWRDAANSEHAMQLCMEKGRVDVLLHEETLSRELFDGLTYLLGKILTIRMYAQLEPYDNAGQIIRRYTYHAKTHCTTFTHFSTLAVIAYYLEADEEVWDRRYEQNWKPHERHAAQEAIALLAQETRWREQAIAHFLTDEVDDVFMLCVLKLYNELRGERILQKLALHPMHELYYYMLGLVGEREEVEQLVRFCDRFLPLAEASEKDIIIVQIVLGVMERFPGVGAHLLEASLESEHETLAFFALLTLRMQGKDSWSPAIYAAVQKATKKAKQDAIKQMAKEMLET